MSDVRKLNLDDRAGAKVAYGNQSEFIMTDAQLGTFLAVLPELERSSYWSPMFQAWYPFVASYFRSGVNPELAQLWSKRINAKLELLGPAQGKFSDCFKELLYMSRTKDTEAFNGFFWAQIEEFYNWIPLLLQNEKVIYSTLANQGFIRNQLDALLEYNKEDGLSPLLHEAVYLYRHCNVDAPGDMVAIRKEVEQQCRIYCDKFSAAFEAAAYTCDSSKSVYAWYRSNVKQLICNAWITATDLSATRHPITRNDVMQLPVWLSDQLTAYVNDLPCVCDLDVNTMYAFNALQAIMSANSNIADHASLYAYTLPRANIRNVLTRLNTFSWDVTQGSFFKELYFRMEQRYVKDTTGTVMSPPDYINSLIARGFPVKG